jgi:hypothetical protein
MPTHLRNIIMCDVYVNQILKIKPNSEASDKMRDTYKIFVTKNTYLTYLT